MQGALPERTGRSTSIECGTFGERALQRNGIISIINPACMLCIVTTFYKVVNYGATFLVSL